MKTSLLSTLTAATLLAAALTAHAQTWQALLPSPTNAPASRGIAVLIEPFSDPANPSVFIGCLKSSSGSATVLRLTPNNPLASSFSTVEVDGGLTYVARLAHNPGDGLYAVGHGPKDPNARNIVNVWQVRKSQIANQGGANTWNPDDTFFLGKSSISLATGITTDSAGYVHVSGQANEGRNYHWVVRRKAAGVWTTVYDAQDTIGYMTPAMCFFPGNAQNPTPAMFTAGTINSKWKVLRSQNQGAVGTWTSVDTWPSGTGEASAYDAACDSHNGYLYVVGTRGLNGKNPSAWVIRMSADGGNTWNTLLDVAGAGSWAAKFAIDGGGNATVSGVINPTYEQQLGTKPLWTVVRNSPGQPWSTSWASRTHPFGLTTQSKGSGLAADASGNLFLTGSVDDWTDSDGYYYPGGRVGVLRMVP